MAETRFERPTAGAEGKRPPLPSLTGMRGVASVIVFLCHIIIVAGDLPYDVDILGIFEDADVRDTYRTVFGVVGYTCVSFFFVTSGFILTWARRQKDTRRSFWRRRFFKIFPLHLVTYAIGMVCLTGTLTSAADIPGVFLLQNWIPDNRVIFGSNGPSWSISAELFFYLMFPLLLPWINRIKETRLFPWLIGITVAVFAVTVFSYTVVPVEHQVWFSYVFPPVRILEFVAGIVLARLVISGRWFNLGLAPAGLLLLASCVVARNVPEVFAFAAVTFVPVVLLVGAGITADLGGRQNILGGRFLVWLGDLSFAFYLVHLSVLVGARRLVGMDQSWSIPGALVFMAVTYGVTLFCAWVLHTYIENPAMRRWSSPPRPTRPATTGGAPEKAMEPVGPQGDTTSRDSE